MASDQLPLSGYRIIDMTEVWAGPEAATYMAEMGADVIRIESYPRASQNRPLIMPLPGAPQGVTGTADEPKIWERATSYHIANHSKRGIAVDAGKPEGHEVLMRLVETADVLMVGFSAGTAAKLKLDYETVRPHKPDIVMVSMPGWGERGLYQGFSTIGSGLDAFVGHHHLRSYPGLGVTSNTSSVVHSDAAGCLIVAFGIMAALHYRERSGKGQFIDMSQAEALMTHVPRQFFELSMNGRVQEAVGNTDPTAVPHNSYQCKVDDTWVVIAVRSDDQWRSLVAALGSPEWAMRPELASMAGRLAHRDEIDARIGEWTRQHGHIEAFDILRTAGVPSAPVYNSAEVMDDPHLAARNFWRPMSHPYTATYIRPSLPWRMSKTATEITRHTNLLGQHNQEVLRELGYNDSEIEALSAADVLGTEYRKGGDVD